MRITGIVEVTCAPFLIIGSGSLRTLTGLALTVTMLVAIYTLYALQYKPAEFIPAIVCLGLLILDGYFLDIDANYGGFDTKRTKLS